MTVGIICEYNPFHNGHLYQINKIREIFGEDTVIVALMSGNFTQRGETAIADKGLRAKTAVLSGVNLVIELPFPFSMSSAEFFASSAIHILNSLNCIDILSFGSESGDISKLESIADAMLSKEFQEMMSDISGDERYKKNGYPKLCEIALNLICGDVLNFKFTPNNILGLEYIKALKRSKSKITPHTIKRTGNDFNDIEFVPGNIQSASAIRNSIVSKDISAMDYIPHITKKCYLDAIKHGDFPCDINKLSTAIILYFRLNSPMHDVAIHDAQGGLYNRIKENSCKTNDLEKLIESVETKKFTQSRIKRAILNSLLGVTSSQLKELPMYAQLLAADDKGCKILKSVSKDSAFTILTKPSDFNKLSSGALLQKKKSDMADSIFELTKPTPKDGNSMLRFTPFVKK